MEEDASGLPVVSVIIPVLNGEEYLESIVGHVMSQTFDDWEIVIVVSSRCTDSTLVIAGRLSDGDRIRVVDYVDTGALGGSKNAGLDESRGRYVWFLDVDDIPSSLYLSTLVEIAERESADVVGCNYLYSVERGPFEDLKGEFPVDVMDSREALRRRATERFPVASWSMIYRRSMVFDNGIRFEEGFSEDISFTVRSLTASGTVCYCHRPLYKYMRTPGSICQSSRDSRGRSEVDRYNHLEASLHPEDPDRAFLARRFTLTRMRSAGHMTFKGFLRYVYSDEYLEMVSRNRSLQVCFECACQHVVPYIYFGSIRLFFRIYYYNSGRYFTHLRRKLR